MAKTPFSGYGSFRKPVKKIGAFPRAHEIVAPVWTPKINDRVQTPSGVGVVVEISDNMYLVDLDNQLAKVWERLTSIKRLM